MQIDLSVIINRVIILQSDHKQTDCQPRTTVKAKCLTCNLEASLSAFSGHTAPCCNMYTTTDVCIPISEVDENASKLSNSDSIVQTLQSIFADKAIEDLQQAASQASDTHAAVDIILDDLSEISLMATEVLNPETSVTHAGKGTAAITSLKL